MMKNNELTDWFEMTFRKGYSRIQANHELCQKMNEKTLMEVDTYKFIKKYVYESLAKKQSRRALNKMKTNDELIGITEEFTDSIYQKMEDELTRHYDMAILPDYQGIIPNEYVVEGRALTIPTVEEIIYFYRRHTDVIKRIVALSDEGELNYRRFIQSWINNQPETKDISEFSEIINDLEGDFYYISSEIHEVQRRMEQAYCIAKTYIELDYIDRKIDEWDK